MQTIGRCLATAILLIACFATGCSDNKDEGEGKRTVSSSSGDFGRGYKDAQRDAKWSLTDTSGSWTWLWMMNKEYQDGYNQGWKDGRGAAKLENKQQQRQSDEPKGGTEQGFPEL